VKPSLTRALRISGVPKLNTKEAIMFTAKVRENSIQKMRPVRLFAVLLVPMVALILGVAAPEVWAVDFAEAEIFFEYNSTDQDLGLHIFFDAVGWKEVEVKDKYGEEIFEVENDEGLKVIGSTEVFTESAEPPLCPADVDEDECDVDAAIEAFQSLFPEGKYKFRGRTVDGRRLIGSAILSHDLPDPPEISSPDPEASDYDFDKFLDDPTIEWEEDTAIEEYEVVAEMVIVIDGEERTFVNTVTLPGGAKQFTVSREFIRLAKRAQNAGRLVEFKVEVIARAENLNKTISESPLFEAEE
jgi:hypothetical protein